MESTTSSSDDVLVIVKFKKKKKKNRSIWVHPILFLREEMGEFNTQSRSSNVAQ